MYYLHSGWKAITEVTWLSPTRLSNIIVTTFSGRVGSLTVTNTTTVVTDDDTVYTWCDDCAMVRFILDSVNLI